MQDIDAMMAHMHHEDVMREIEDEHENIMDDMYFEETKYLQENITIEDMYLEEARYLEETSLECLTNLHSHNDEYIGHVSW